MYDASGEIKKARSPILLIWYRLDKQKISYPGHTLLCYSPTYGKSHLRVMNSYLLNKASTMSRWLYVFWPMKTSPNHAMDSAALLM